MMVKRSTKTKRMTKKIWWSLVLGGSASIVFGLFAMFWPDKTLSVLTWVFGIFVIAMGALWAYQGLTHMKTDRLWWLSALFGALAVSVGIYSIASPTIVITLFTVLLTIYIFAQSLLDLVIASYSERSDKWIWVMIGALGIVLGLVIIFNPLSASMAFVWVLGLYALIHGMAAIASAMMAKDQFKK